MASIPGKVTARRSLVVHPSPSIAVLLWWSALIVLAYGIGTILVADDAGIELFAPPLFGRFDPHLEVGTVTAVLVAGVVVLAGFRVADRAGWRMLVATTASTAAVWAMVVAATSGLDALYEPLLSSSDYLRAVTQVGSPGAFLEGFADRITRYPTHVQGHPPGMVLLLWSLDAIGLGGAQWAAAVVISVGGSTAAAVLIVLRETAGESSARRAAPFIAASSIAIWLATSADALFAGVGAWGICCAVLACRREGARSNLLAVAAGVLLGALLFLTYGGVLLVGVAAVLVAAHRNGRVAALAAGGIAAVAGAFLLAGFWWFDGLSATRAAYAAGVASDRPYAFFVLANLAALAVATGPAVAAGLRRLPWRSSSWLPVVACLAAVALANLSGLSKGEVERIWLPFAVWIVPIASLAPGDRRGWLAVQVSWTLLVQTIVRTPW